MTQQLFRCFDSVIADIRTQADAFNSLERAGKILTADAQCLCKLPRADRLMCMLMDIFLCLLNDRMVGPLAIFRNKITELIQTGMRMADHIVDGSGLLDQLNTDVGGRKRKLRFHNPIQHGKLDDR